MTINGRNDIFCFFKTVTVDKVKNMFLLTSLINNSMAIATSSALWTHSQTTSWIWAWLRAWIVRFKSDKITLERTFTYVWDWLQSAMLFHRTFQLVTLIVSAIVLLEIGWKGSRKVPPRMKCNTIGQCSYTTILFPSFRTSFVYQKFVIRTSARCKNVGTTKDKWS